jgi:hypothetical protein
MSLTAVEQALLPTDEEVMFYREHGWYRSKPIVPEALIDEAIVGMHRHFQGERDWALPPTSGYSDWKPGDGHIVRNAEVVALQNRQLRKLMMHPLLAAVAAKLTGSSAIRYFADTLVFKPEELPESESVVGWHTDLAYWGTCTSTNLLTAWIPFQDCTEDMGPLLYVDRSHHWPGTADLRTFRCKDLGELERRFPDQGPLMKVPMTLRKGEVSFHNCRLVHGSGPNISRFSRAAFAVHLQDASNRYRVHLNQKGVPWHIFIDDLLRKGADGLPDYGDPNVLPILWSAAAAAERWTPTARRSLSSTT